VVPLALGAELVLGVDGRNGRLTGGAAGQDQQDRQGERASPHERRIRSIGDDDGGCAIIDWEDVAIGRVGVAKVPIRVSESGTTPGR
jgi:hypothetical protein